MLRGFLSSSTDRLSQMRAERHGRPGTLNPWSWGQFPRRAFTTAAPPPHAPRPVTLRARPLLLISTFLVLHQAVATTSLFPTYYFFKLTDSATSLLAGPYAAFVLRQPAPWPLASRGSDAKIEDVVEKMLRASVARGWGLWSRWRGRNPKAGADAEGAAIADDVVEGLEGGKPRWRDRVVGAAQSAQVSWKDRQDANGAAAVGVAADDAAKGWSLRTKAVEGASELKLKDMMNMAAAYLVVKVCPCFLPLYLI